MLLEKEENLIILIDDLDVLLPTYNSTSFDWLPKKTPQCMEIMQFIAISMILSLSNDAMMKSIKTIIPERNIIAVEDLTTMEKVN